MAQALPDAPKYAFDSFSIDAGLIAAGVVAKFTIDPFLKPVLEGLVSREHSAIFSAVAGLHGTLLGFALAAFAIVLGYIAQPRFRLLRDAGQVENIARIFLASIRTHAVGAAIALVGIVGAANAPYQPAITWITTLLLLLAGVRLLRILWVTRQIVEALK